MANSNFISAVAFSAIEAISTVFKIRYGEITFKEGMDNLGEIFTTGMVIAKGMAIVGKAGGIIATLAGMMGAGGIGNNCCKCCCRSSGSYCRNSCSENYIYWSKSCC